MASLISKDILKEIGCLYQISYSSLGRQMLFGNSNRDLMVIIGGKAKGSKNALT